MRQFRLRGDRVLCVLMLAAAARADQPPDVSTLKQLSLEQLSQIVVTSPSK